jgi:hypothetical protein
MHGIPCGASYTFRNSIDAVAEPALHGSRAPAVIIYRDGMVTRLAGGDLRRLASKDIPKQ